ncbi:hypothetical protein SPHINGO8BC_51136 [Sphingobacterium multivorum]|uniref:Uncharacterized protein n=1 Tax=Sphingobacterium multivorum TaxID=28454 RepID=A0A654CY52_SPHMU|nr:hypothetical protein SPHINGO8BC_51136 [Sphingobacterium multivorum]
MQIGITNGTTAGTQTFSKKYKNSCLSQIQNLSMFPYIYTHAPRATVMSIS